VVFFTLQVDCMTSKTCFSPRSVVRRRTDSPMSCCFRTAFSISVFFSLRISLPLRGYEFFSFGAVLYFPFQAEHRTRGTWASHRRYGRPGGRSLVPLLPLLRFVSFGDLISTLPSRPPLDRSVFYEVYYRPQISLGLIFFYPRVRQSLIALSLLPGTV